MYERVSRFQTRLNGAKVVTSENITRACRQTPGARLGSVKSACTRYVTSCAPLPVPSSFSGASAHTDADTEGNLSVAAGAMDACWLGSAAKDYRSCRRLPNAGVPLGRGPGQVEVTAAQKTAYTLVGHSPSGTDFKLDKQGGGVGGGRTTMTCSRPGRGECSQAGSWTSR